MSMKILAPTGIRFPDRPARSESLYLLRYPGSSISISISISSSSSGGGGVGGSSSGLFLCFYKFPVYCLLCSRITSLVISH
jgi:hypothetical protein